MRSKYSLENGNYKCECGREFDYFQSLNGHFSHCIIHRQSLRKGPLTRKYPPKGVMQGWSNKSKKELQEIHNKSGKTLSRKIKEGLITPAFKGRKETPEHKDKIRQSILKNIELNKGGVRCNYSTKACEFINKLNKERNWNLQHAENGGEVRIGNFWVDGYDKELNIIFEYDEPKHYQDIENNILKEKDLERQNIILSLTNADFYRYNEATNNLYKVN